MKNVPRNLPVMVHQCLCLFMVDRDVQVVAKKWVENAECFIIYSEQLFKARLRC